MNKFAFTLSASVAAICLYALPAAAQTCTAAPSCESLGYEEIAVDCRGKYLKCPFDTTKVTCVTEAPRVGDLKYSLYASNHDGWLRCDGTQYSQTAFPKLYSVLRTNFCHKYTSRTDTSYSINNCKSGYFAVPDYRGFFLRVANPYNAPSNTAGSSSSYYYSDAFSYKGGSYSSSIYTPQHEQLPNITGKAMLLGPNRASSWGKGAFSIIDSGMNWGDGSGKGTKSAGIELSAKNSSPIYDGSHVIPANYSAYVFIYAGE